MGSTTPISSSRFRTLRTAAELARANQAFVGALKEHATRRRRQTIGTAGGSKDLMTWHLPGLDMWIAPDVIHNRTWNALGVGDPFAKSKVPPALEINFPLRARSSATAGMALLDERGVLAFAHFGRVGGGRPGIGKASFTAHHPVTETAIVDGKDRDLYLLGDLADPGRLA